MHNILDEYFNCSHLSECGCHHDRRNQWRSNYRHHYCNPSPRHICCRNGMGSKGMSLVQSFILGKPVYINCVHSQEMWFAFPPPKKKITDFIKLNVIGEFSHFRPRSSCSLYSSQQSSTTSLELLFLFSQRNLQASLVMTVFHFVFIWSYWQAMMEHLWRWIQFHLSIYTDPPLTHCWS